MGRQAVGIDSPCSSTDLGIRGWDHGIGDRLAREAGEERDKASPSLASLSGQHYRMPVIHISCTLLELVVAGFLRVMPTHMHD